MDDNGTGSAGQDHNLPTLSSSNSGDSDSTQKNDSNPSPFEQLATENIHTPGNNPDTGEFPSNELPILNTDDTRNRFKKVALGIFGVLLLVGGVAAGVLLVQREQDIRQKAASCSVEGDSCEQTICCDGYVCRGTAGNRVCQQKQDGTCNSEGAQCGGVQGYVGFKCSRLSNGQCNDNPQMFNSFGEAAAYAGICGQVDEVWVGGPCNKNLCGDFAIFDSGCEK